MTTKTCEVDGVTYEAVPQGEPEVPATFGGLWLCNGCAACPEGQHNIELCTQLGDCMTDNIIIWVVKV